MVRILVVGELNPDIILTGVPVREGRLRFDQAESLVTGTTLTLGSSAAITASAIVRAGGQASLLAVVGDDELGRSALTRAAQRGVDVSAVKVAVGRRTGSSVILVSDTDPRDRAILTYLGTMSDLSADDVTDELLTSAGHVHVASFFMHVGGRDRLHERLARARQLGATVSLDTNDDPSREWTHGAPEALRQSDVLFANDSELVGLAAAVGLAAGVGPALALLATMPTSATADPRLPAVVHKQGERGATVLTRSGAVHVSAPTVEVIDTVGAGDSLAGTVLAALTAGADWPEALALGVAAGSLSTTAAGGVEAQPDRASTLILANSLTRTDSRTDGHCASLTDSSRGAP